MTVVRRWVATAVVVSLLVAGCSDDPEPKFEPSPSSSQSESASEPAEPKAWEVKSEKGAVAFAKHWMDVFSKVMDGDGTSELREISASQCAICRDFVERLDRIYSSGGYYRSQGWDVLAAASVKGQPAGDAAVSLRIRESAAVSRESSDSKVIRTASTKSTWSSRMTWSGSGWVMTDLRLVQ